MRHIGDVHTHLPQSAVGEADRQGIVKVFGIFGVDGAGIYLSEVLSFGNILWGYLGIYLFCGSLHLFGIFVGQSVLCQYGVHLGIVLPLFS